MLYKETIESELAKELFEHPPSEYRGAPFWAWNCKLDRETLLRQIPYFKEMGMGGFHIHCRVGLDTPYLGSEYFQQVHACVEEAKKDGLLCRLYDEDRWPSGSAGGMVTKEEKYRSRFLVFSPEDYKEVEDEGLMSAAKAIHSDNKRELGRFEVILNGEGYLKSYQRLAENEISDHTWIAYLEISGNTPWFNDQAYLNTLDKAAVNRFIELTHEVYYKELKEEFGREIPSIFTDEPQISHKEVLEEPFEYKSVVLPFTDDFKDSFCECYGISIMEHIPELLWERADGEVSQVRYLYHRHICERFSEAFGDNVGRWCEKHQISLTGHMMNEWTLHSQTMAAGEVMRPMKEFDFPGIDMLCDRREFSTAKQAQSVAHQFNREGVMSEIYGVTGWDFDFRGHKLAGDWQAALGVTLRVPHLTWVSMGGEGKRDYPAGIGYQSPWYKEYSYIEDHFARLNTALTRGKPAVRIGVIHPIESYWLYWGNKKQTAGIRQELEENFENIIQWLLFGLLDFDFISEELLSEDVGVNSEVNGFSMGEMNYQVIIVPGCHTIRSTTVDKLKNFADNGGKVIFMGTPPEYVEGIRSAEAINLAGKCMKIPYSKNRLLQALEPWRDVDIMVQSVEEKDSARMEHVERGIRADNLFYQLRLDGKNKWLFICNVHKPVSENIAGVEEWKIEVKGAYRAKVYDTLTGEIRSIETDTADKITKISYFASHHDSLLLLLEEVVSTVERKEDIKHKSQLAEFIYQPYTDKNYLPRSKSYQLEEPNVLLLDMVEYAFDEGTFQEEEEILRIDNLFRRKLGYPLRMEALAQPWTQKGCVGEPHLLHLRFEIMSEIEKSSVEFAMEDPEGCIVIWNGEQTQFKDCGWFVDECIRKTRLTGLKKGRNELVLTMPFQKKTNAEWCYLLGDFGVQVTGRMKKLIPLPESLFYGNISNQGFPFYAGNLTYEIPIECEEGDLNIEISHYKGALIQLELDGTKCENIIFSPYVLKVGRVDKGSHNLKIKVFGNRANAFGPVHNADANEEWYGPNLWRTTGSKWSYEYKLKEFGVLETPRYWVAQN